MGSKFCLASQDRPGIYPGHSGRPKKRALAPGTGPPAKRTTISRRLKPRSEDGRVVNVQDKSRTYLRSNRQQQQRAHGEEQIPCGDDNRKDKGNCVPSRRSFIRGLPRQGFILPSALVQAAPYKLPQWTPPPSTGCPENPPPAPRSLRPPPLKRVPTPAASRTSFRSMESAGSPCCLPSPTTCF